MCRDLRLQLRYGAVRAELHAPLAYQFKPGQLFAAGSGTTQRRCTNCDDHVAELFL